MSGLEVTTYLDPAAPLYAVARAYLDALLGGQRREAQRLVREAIAAGARVPDIYLYVFEPTQREIGLMWEHNQVSVADEHYCTAATQLIMSQLWPLILASPRCGRSALLAAVPSDLHELGLRIVADFFELAGWDVHYLGANTPVEAIVGTTVRRRPDLLGVAASMPRYLEPLADVIELLRISMPDAPPVLVGGLAFDADPSLWLQLDADGHAVGGLDGVATAERLLGSRGA